MYRQYTLYSQEPDPNEFLAYISSIEARVQQLELTLRSVLEENLELKWLAHYNYESGDVEPLDDVYRSH